MPTKNAHHTHKDASGQNATLPMFCLLFRARRSGTRNPTNFRQFSNESIKPKQKQNAMFSHAAKTRKSSVGWLVLCPTSQCGLRVGIGV